MFWQITFLVSSVLIILILLLIFFIKKRPNQSLKELALLKEENIKLNIKLDFFIKQEGELKDKISKLEADKSNLEINNARIMAEINQERKYVEEKIKEIKELKQDFTLNFKNISNDIIKEQKADFDKSQKEGLSNLLNPFKEQIKDFNAKLTEVNQNNIEGKSRIEEQIKSLKEMNMSLTNEAKELTEALKGNKKLQGNWGELQIERIFEITGFQEGVNYTKQESTRSENGDMHRPDYIIILPNNRKIILDAKVSLNSYIEYIKAEDENKKEKYLNEHIQAIKNHIKGLSSKEYQKEIKSNSLDYVFIFMPIEQAYLEALSKDNTIYDDAYKHNIAITTPSSILPILRTIENLWKIEKQNKNVQEIARLGGALYDKFVGFLSDMEAIKNKLDGANNSYTDAMKKLSTGKGNAISIAANLKNLGAKTVKNLGIDYDSENNIDA